MKTLKLLLLSLVFSVAGCAGQFNMFKPGNIPVDQSLTAPAQTAQNAINEANVLVGSIADVIGSDAENHIMSKEEAQKYLDQVKDIRKKLKDAQALLDAGNPLAAANKTELIKQTITALQQELTRQAAK